MRTNGPPHWSESVGFSEVEKPLPGNKAVEGQLPSRGRSTGVAYAPSPYSGKIGAPTLYQDEFPDIVLELSARGYSMTAIAGHLGITRGDIDDWSSVHPLFEQAVARALTQRQYYAESKFLGVCETGGAGSQGITLMYLLRNLKSGEFVDKQQIEHSGSMDLQALVAESLKAPERLESPITIEHEAQPIDKA